MTDVRETLDHLIHAQGADYAALSRLLGRNAAYVQQFIRRGVPRKLDEDDRRTLARYFGVDEAVLGGPPPPIAPATRSRTRGADGLVSIPQLRVRASAGPGSISDQESARATIAIDAGALRQMTRNPGQVEAIRVTGDSMEPTLVAGDTILVDRSDAAETLRDGIYVLRSDDVLNVKRLALNPANGCPTIRSDNPAYPDWPDCDLSRITIVGRVVWVGRRLP